MRIATTGPSSPQRSSFSTTRASRRRTRGVTDRTSSPRTGGCSLVITSRRSPVRATHRPGARGAVRIPPGLHVDPLRCGARGRRTRLRGAHRLRAARRALVRGDRAGRARALPGSGYRRCGSVHRYCGPRGARPSGRRSPGRVGVGCVHHRNDDPHRHRDGRLHFRSLQGQRPGYSTGHRRRRGAPVLALVFGKSIQEGPSASSFGSPRPR